VRQRPSGRDGGLYAFMRRGLATDHGGKFRRALQQVMHCGTTGRDIWLVAALDRLAQCPT
jgi:hypothetical protein